MKTVSSPSFDRFYFTFIFKQPYISFQRSNKHLISKIRLNKNNLFIILYLHNKDGYIFKITGGFDKDGFAMKNGILTQARKRILLQKGSKNFRFKKGYHRPGVRKRQLVRGCIVSPDIKVLNLKITKIGSQAIPGKFLIIFRFN